MKISPSSVMFRGFLSVLLFVLCLPLLWAQNWTEPPTVTRIAPLIARAGDEITIHGEKMNVGNRLLETSRVHVSFTGSSAQRTAPMIVNGRDSNMMHRVTVPDDATSGPITIRYVDNEVVHDNTDSDTANDKDLNGDNKQDANDHFIFVSVTGTEPAQITKGAEVTLRGTGFSVVPSNPSAFVIFGAPPNTECESTIGFPCRVSSSVTTDGTSVTFTVPECATPGNGVIVVISPDVSGVVDGTFPLCLTVDYNFQFAGADPEFTSFSPASARVGTEVTIRGMNFSLSAADNEVAFGNDSFSEATSVRDLGSGAIELKVRVPADAATGKIKLKVGGGTPILSPTDFTRLSHTVTSFRPMAVLAGQTITIEGTNFG